MQCSLNAIRTNQLDLLQSLSLDDWKSIRNEWNLPAAHMIVTEYTSSIENNDNNNNDDDEWVMKIFQMLNDKGYDMNTTVDMVRNSVRFRI